MGDMNVRSGSSPVVMKLTFLSRVRYSQCFSASWEFPQQSQPTVALLRLPEQALGKKKGGFKSNFKIKRVSAF